MNYIFSYINCILMSSMRFGEFHSPMNHEHSIFYAFLQILESLAPYGVTVIYESNEGKVFD